MPDTAVKWTDTVTVNTNTANTQRNPRIIQLENGDILVAWETDDPAGAGSPAGYDMIAQRFDQGGTTVGGEFRINIGWSGDDEMDLSLDVVPGLGFITVYEDQSVATSLRLSVLQNNGNSVHNNTIINDLDAALNNYRNPEIAVASATSALIVYEEVNASGSDMKAKIYNPTTNVLGAEFPVLNGTSIADASVTALTNGNFVVTSTVDSGDPGIFMRIFDSSGASVLGATQISGTTSNGFDDEGARVEALTGGGFVVAWEGEDASDRDISYQLFNANGTANGSRKFFPAVLATNDENYTELRITALSDGGFAILADNQVEFDLRLQRFDSSGNTVGTLIGLSDLNESQIDITVLADGRMALVYNNGADIRMQIFDTRDAASAGLDFVGVGTAADEVMDEETPAYSGGIFAGGGNDTVIISNHATNGEIFDGGAGTDTLQLHNFAGASTIDLLFGTRILNTAQATVDTVRNFENATGANGNDAIYGTDGNNILIGLDGNDILWGRGGADTMTGGAGDDTYLVDNVGDTVTEAASEGNDTIYTSVDFTLGDNIEIAVNTSTGTAGATVQGNTGDNVLILTNTMSTGNSFLYGVNGNNTLYMQNNTFAYGGDGMDTFVMTGNNNSATGGHGDDTYIITGTDNRITEYAGATTGTDTVYAYTQAYTLDASVEILALITFDANFAQNGTGNVSNNTLIGSGSNNILSGLDGGDFLIGGGGDDTLIGGAGLDVLQGNVGNDIFLYNSFGELGDIIQDWVNTDDSFHFSGLAFGIGVGASLTDGVNFISSTAPTSVAAQATFLWDSDDYDLYYDGDGTGTGVSAVLVASLQDFTTVDVSDFVFF